MQTRSPHRSAPAPCSIRAPGSLPWPRRSPKLIFPGVGFYSSGLKCLLLNRVESNCLKINFGSELAPKKLTSNSLLTEPRWYFPLERAEPQPSFPQGGTWCRACCVLPCKKTSSASPQHSELTSGVITCCPNAVTPTANNNKAPLSIDSGCVASSITYPPMGMQVPVHPEGRRKAPRRLFRWDSTP